MSYREEDEIIFLPNILLGKEILNIRRSNKDINDNSSVALILSNNEIIFLCVVSTEISAVYKPNWDLKVWIDKINIPDAGFPFVVTEYNEIKEIIVENELDIHINRIEINTNKGLITIIYRDNGRHLSKDDMIIANWYIDEAWENWDILYKFDYFI